MLSHLRVRQLWASLGALLGLAGIGCLGHVALGPGADLPLLIAPLGAAAVLLFAAPDSPLAKPWPVIGGNVLSALVGVACATWISDLTFAAAIACGLSMVVMSMGGCLHPPGGAISMTAVLGGPSIKAAGFGFAFWPVGISAILLMLTAYAFAALQSRLPHTLGTTRHGR